MSERDMEEALLTLWERLDEAAVVLVIRAYEGGRHGDDKPEVVRLGRQPGHEHDWIEQREVHAVPNRFLGLAVAADVVGQEQRIEAASLKGGRDLFPVGHLPPLIADLVLGIHQLSRVTGAAPKSRNALMCICRFVAMISTNLRTPPLGGSMP